MPVLLDGAQGVGAVAVDVRGARLRRLRGRRPEVAVRPGRHGHAVRERAPARAPVGLAPRLRQPAEAGDGLDAALHEDARRFDTLGTERRDARLRARGDRACWRGTGWTAVHERARALAARLAELLAEPAASRPRARATTLVSFPSADPAAERAQLSRSAGVVVRNIPGRPWLRASVGAWNDEHDLDRLLRTLST